MKNKTTYAPSPWRKTLINGNWHVAAILGGGQIEVAKVTALKDKSLTDTHANLVESAPELFEVLKWVHEEMGTRISPAAFDEFSDKLKANIDRLIKKVETDTQGPNIQPWETNDHHRKEFAKTRPK